MLITIKQHLTKLFRIILLQHFIMTDMDGEKMLWEAAVREKMKEEKTCPFGFLSIGYSMNGTEQDVIAHEYAHIVARQYGAAIGDSSESGAVSEGLADTLLAFVQMIGISILQFSGKNIEMQLIRKNMLIHPL